MPPTVEKHPTGRKHGRPSYRLHFAHLPVHNTKKVKQTFNECKCRRLGRSPYALYFSPCDFYLFDSLHAKKKLLSYGTVEWLEQAMIQSGGFHSHDEGRFFSDGEEDCGNVSRIMEITLSKRSHLIRFVSHILCGMYQVRFT
jgi:hypothetical protein